jgi:hypothetical protein
MLEDNHKNISERIIYQNAQEITEDWLGRSKYTRLKKLTMYFRLMKASLAKED